MAKDIKTKEKVIEKKTKGSVGKAADRAKILSVKAKDVAVEAKDKVEQNTVADDRSPEQYAAEEVTEGMEKAVDDATIVADKTIRATGKKVKEKIKKRKAEKTENTDDEQPQESNSEEKPEDKKDKPKDKSDDKKPDEKQPKKKEQSADKTQPDGKTKPTEEQSHTVKEDVKPQSDTQKKQKKTVDEKKKPKQRKQTPPKTRGELSVKKPKTEQQPVKYAHSAENKIKQTARSSANAKNTIKTAENTAKTVHKAEKTAQKTVETAKKTKKAEEAARKTAQATAKTAKAVGKAVVEAAKATAAAVKELGAAMAAGGAPVVIIIIVCLLIAVAGTCFGIFLSNDESTGSQMTMTQAISQLTTDYYTDLEAFKNNYQYDQYEIKTGSGNITIDWKTVLAVYAVKTTTSTEDAYEVATLDDTKYELLKTVLYDMNPKSGQVTQKSVPIVTVTTDENGVSIKQTTYETKKVLTVTIGHLSAQEICDFYSFNDEQKAMLDELLSEEYNDLWDELIHASGAIVFPGGTQIGSGGFVWPVAGPYSITSRFGTRVDPISGAIKTHGGTDIAAAQGTPIVAAADGTVVISSYMAGGYGYYVKIQHDGTYSTLYGHCSVLLVSAGQQVKQGQLIAQVGSTGYSTGPHCHFEVIQNGIRVDALQFFN